jgi:propanol-preferring alcohol dehydrogenase
MLLEGVSDLKTERFPLLPRDVPDPKVGVGEVLLKVNVCAVCHTELDEIEGRTPPSRYPVIPGHQVVGTVAQCGPDTVALREGDRVGVGWIFTACGTCPHCRAGNENLCSDFVATGRDVDGGYAEAMVVPEAFAHPIPEFFGDSEAAPLLCAGAIGYRSLGLTEIENGQKLGLTGFGASAHIVLKMSLHRFPETPVFVFARSERERAFAKELGASWTGDTADTAPYELDAIIDTTPAWKPVVEALKNLAPGGRLVINAIRKEEGDQRELLRLDYPSHLWMEKEIKSVANVARRDITEFLDLAVDMRIEPEVQEFPLHRANTALLEVKEGKIRGAKVLRVS